LQVSLVSSATVSTTSRKLPASLSTAVISGNPIA
jgi:hypothetical protein